MMLVCAIAIYFSVLGVGAVEIDECTGMSKAMRRIKCKKVSKNELPEDWDIRDMKEKMYQNFSSVVQDQYTDLPYPPFSMSDMVREKNYYALAPDSYNRPIFYQHTNSLNILNHYLYKVKQNICPSNTFLKFSIRARKCLMKTSLFLPLEEELVILSHF